MARHTLSVFEAVGVIGMALAALTPRSEAFLSTAVGVMRLPARHGRSAIRFALVAVAVALPSMLAATTVIAPTFEQLVSKAEVVFAGEVIDTKSRPVTDRHGTTIVTDVYFRVERVLKGQVGPMLILEFLGGTVGDRTFRIDGIPKFVVGDRDVLFATPSQRLASPLVAMMYGRVRIETEPSTKQQSVHKFDGTPLREASAVTFRDPLPVLTRIPSMSLAAFEDAVLTEVSRQNGRVR